MIILDMKRKCRREISFTEISSVEIPRSKSNMSGDTCHMMMKNGANAVRLNFDQEDNRIDFCQNLKSLEEKIEIKDYSLAGDPECLRFNVAKINKVGIHKERVIYIDSKKKILRSINLDRTYKEVILKDERGPNLLVIERNLNDKRRLDLEFKNREPLHFLLESSLQRERFLNRCRTIMDPQYYKKDVRDSVLFFKHNSNVPEHKKLLEKFQKRSASTSKVSDTSENSIPTIYANKGHRTVKIPSFFEYKKLLENGVSVFVGTWNVAQNFVEDDLEDFIPLDKFEIYAIGLQECRIKDRSKWESELKKHIDMNFHGQTKGSYKLIKHHALREINVFLFIREDIMSKVTNIQAHSVACGVGNVVGNKGGAAVSFHLYESRLCFITSHLAARSERIEERRNDYRRICRGLNLGANHLDVLSQFHHIFWFGDLNYRTVGEFSAIQRLWKDCIRTGKWSEMWHTDQMKSEMAKNRVFFDFQEGDLNFGPTYRFEKKSNEFSNKNFQNPSWTDRILHRSLPGMKMLQRRYYSAPNLFGSDHRPVGAVYEFVPMPAPNVLDSHIQRRMKLLEAEIRLNDLSVKLDLPEEEEDTTEEMEDAKTHMSPKTTNSPLSISSLDWVRQKNNSSSSTHFLENLAAVNKSGQTRIQAIFDSAVTEKKLKKETISEEKNKWEWKFSNIKLIPFLPIEDFIQKNYVTVTFKLYTNEASQLVRLGYATIPLFGTTKHREFRVDIIYSGTRVAELKGSIQLIIRKYRKILVNPKKDKITAKTNLVEQSSPSSTNVSVSKLDSLEFNIIEEDSDDEIMKRKEVERKEKGKVLSSVL
eukprot:CAMPEP_0167770134 /NCGR_PEP_ID=MMETSP0110_2-20121227/17742_1 /TAXON_ID=629695 /ORGANISM="Gymnochlora sp., Strain CCMP2014" /LENGTH=817 /DNA_ID=CAMNT_0007659261 /DNA_START=477 /DNA_END=2930 /DNA_ORIENTATION=+